VAHYPSPTNRVPPLAPGLAANLRFDALSGFLVFLIAMPLCLAIATACRYPPIVGIWTAVIGGILTTFLSNSQMTIKGPAAGLIVIVEGAVLELGAEFAPPGTDPKDLLTITQYGYPLALGVGVVAGIIQIVFGLVKAGMLGEMVPLTPIHGMLAAIGVTIIAKSSFTMVGLAAPPGAPIEAIAALPKIVPRLGDPLIAKVAAVGLTALAIMIVLPFLKNRLSFLKPIPAQLLVLVVAIPMALLLGLASLGESTGNPMKFLVNVPDLIPAVFNDPSIAFHFPNFDGITTAAGIKYIVLFALIGSIESLLSSQAIDLIDPWRRKTDQNRDLLAVGLGNTICAAIGALPMISEIVRSKANIDNGARTKYANLFHGLFLLAFVLLLPFLIRMIPQAALAAMLVFTGYRLASPREFIHALRVGAEQLIVFATTIVVTLCTDLLIGVVSGIALKAVIHLINGMPLSSLFGADIEVAHRDGTGPAVLAVRKAAVFANWLSVRNAIVRESEGRNEVILDLSQTKFVDHSTMEKLHQLETAFEEFGKRLTITGLENHTPLSSHPLAARRGNAAGLGKKG
jgi:MFS superfamily sulfate permease-like transporter